MQAYENPTFVEDLARKACLALRGIEGIADFRIACRNEESIHTHNAVAVYQTRAMGNEGI